MLRKNRDQRSHGEGESSLRGTTMSNCIGAISTWKDGYLAPIMAHATTLPMTQEFDDLSNDQKWVRRSSGMKWTIIVRSLWLSTLWTSPRKCRLQFEQLTRSSHSQRFRMECQTSYGTLHSYKMDFDRSSQHKQRRRLLPLSECGFLVVYRWTKG